MNILPDFPNQPALSATSYAKPRRKRWRNYLYGAGGLLALLFVVLLLTAVFFPVDLLKGNLIKAVEGQTGLRCTIGSLASNTLGGSFSLREFKLTDPRRELATPLLYLKEARLKIALTSLPGILAGRPIVLEELHIASGSFNSELFEPLPHKEADAGTVTTSAAPSAPEVQTVPGTAPSRADHGVIVKFIKVADVRVYGRASLPESPALRIRSGEIRQRTAQGYTFNLDVLGKNAGELTLQGNIDGLDFPSFDRAILQSEARCVGLMQQDIYEALGLPLHTEVFGLAPLDGVLMLELRDNTTTLRGKLASPRMKITTLPVFTGVKLDFSVSCESGRDRFLFSSVSAHADGGVALDGHGDLVRTATGWHLQSVLKETVLPAELLFGIIGKPEYTTAVQGLLHLQGKLGNADAEGWSFIGKVAAEKFSLAAINPGGEGRITSAIECREKTRLLVLRELKASLGVLEMNGSASLPLGAANHYGDLRIDLNGRVDTAGLKHLPFPFNDCQGVLVMRAGASADDGKHLTYRIALNSGAGSPFVIRLSDMPLPAEAGEIALLAEGSVDLRDNTHNLKQAYIKSKMLNAQFSLQPASAGAECAYTLQFVPQSVLPLFERFLPALHQPAECVQSLTARGRARYLSASSTLNLSGVSLDSAFVNGLAASLTGDFSVTLRDQILRGKKAVLRLYRDKKTVFSAQSGFDWAFAVGAIREDQLDLQMSGDLGTTLALVNECGYLKELVGTRGMAAFNIRAHRQDRAMTIAGAANLVNLDVPLTAARSLHMDSLQASTELVFQEAASQLTVKKFMVTSPDGLLSATASGQLDFSDGLSGKFTLNSEADLAALIKISGAGGAPWLSGRVSTVLNLAGTSEKPELVLSCRAPDLMLGSVAPLHKLVEPLLQAHVGWEATAAGVRNVVISDLSLKTRNESLAIRGQADSMRVRDGVLDFGRGCAANFQMRSTRTLLAFIFPRTNLLIREPGKPDALSFSGQVVATHLPLTNSFRDVKGNIVIPKELTLRNSIFRLDELRTDYIAFTDIMAAPSLSEGVLRVEKGSGDLGGPVQFGLMMDFNQTPVSARATTSGINLNLPDCLNGLKIRTRFDSGKLSFPWPLNRKQIVATWSGLDLPAIKKSLVVEETGIHLEDMRLTTKLQMPDFKRMLSYDLPEDLAEEGAKRMRERFAARYANPVSPYYKSIDLSFNVKDGVLTITQCNIGGGDTADFELQGKIDFDGALDMYLRPVKNMSNTFDAATAMDLPMIRKVILGLPVAQQEKARSILPGWLEEAANRRKLAIHIIGNINEPTIDPKDVRDRIKAELPYILEKIQELLNDKELLNGLLGEKDAKAVENFLQELNK